MFESIKFKIHSRRYDKLIAKQRLEEAKFRQQALDYLLEEADRKIERSDSIMNLYRNIKQGRQG